MDSHSLSLLHFNTRGTRLCVYSQPAHVLFQQHRSIFHPSVFISCLTRTCVFFLLYLRCYSPIHGVLLLVRPSTLTEVFSVKVVDENSEFPANFLHIDRPETSSHRPTSTIITIDIAIDASMLHCHSHVRLSSPRSVSLSPFTYPQILVHRQLHFLSSAALSLHHSHDDRRSPHAARHKGDDCCWYSYTLTYAGRTLYPSGRVERLYCTRRV